MLDDTKLRCVCDPDDLVVGEHAHHCAKCDITWKHGEDLKHSDCSESEFKTAHTCPGCGTDIRDKHWTAKTRRIQRANDIRETDRLVAQMFGEGW